MSKIRILAIPPDKHGVGKFRISDPFTYIGEKLTDDVHVDIVYEAEQNDEFFESYDIVVFHTFIHKTNHIDNINRIQRPQNCRSHFYIFSSSITINNQFLTLYK